MWTWTEFINAVLWVLKAMQDTDGKPVSSGAILLERDFMSCHVAWTTSYSFIKNWLRLSSSLDKSKVFILNTCMPVLSLDCPPLKKFKYDRKPRNQEETRKPRRRRSGSMFISKLLIKVFLSQWFEPRSISSSYCVIVRVSVVLKRTVVGDNNSSFQNYTRTDDHTIRT